MGYRPEPPVYTFQFADGDYEGLEVAARSAPLGKVLDAEDNKELIELLGECLVRWNVEGPDGKPLPANLDGLRECDLAFAVMLTRTWVREITDVSVPLDRPSSAGVTYPEASIPMEPLSASHAN